MKRVVSFALAVAMVLALCACGDAGEADKVNVEEVDVRAEAVVEAVDPLMRAYGITDYTIRIDPLDDFEVCLTEDTKLEYPDMLEVFIGLIDIAYDGFLSDGIKDPTSEDGEETIDFSGNIYPSKDASYYYFYVSTFQLALGAYKEAGIYMRTDSAITLVYAGDMSVSEFKESYAKRLESGKQGNGEPLTEATPEEPKLTKAEAETVLNDYLSSHSGELEDEILNYVLKYGPSEVVSLQYVSVATINDGCGMLYGRDDFGFTLKGTFFGHDEYGNLVGKYNFDWAAVVEADGSVRISSGGTISKN